ncbi:MAG: hypothetical protein ACRERE_24500 [Candidatus Entotheonellia bacterium]
MHIRIMRWRYTTGEPRDFIKAAEWLAEQVQLLLPACYQPDRTGLYLATAEAGAAASVSFWADALREGPGFVNPGDFPWTLANSPAGYLAMRFNLQGPSYTLAGRADAMFSAFQHADDLASARVDHALVIRFDAFAAVTMRGYWLTREPVPEPQDSPSALGYPS